ncbi:MAG: hypothetical protein OXR62_03685 [Ahrensia sp.]|nr:hypothetical protein [Ahrensia sp.]
MSRVIVLCVVALMLLVTTGGHKAISELFASTTPETAISSQASLQMSGEICCASSSVLNDSETDQGELGQDDVSDHQVSACNLPTVVLAGAEPIHSPDAKQNSWADIGSQIPHGWYGDPGEQPPKLA